MGSLIVRLKTNKYKIDITYYLSSLPLGLAIKLNHKAHQSIPTILEFSYYRNFSLFI